jgi:uncharacterized protein
MISAPPPGSAPPPDPTGNDYVSIPGVTPECGIPSVTVIHAGLGGLVEWSGTGDDPLLRLRVEAGGRNVAVEGARWRRLDRWIPEFQLKHDELSITGSVCAPAGYPSARGFMVRVELEHGGRRNEDVTLSLDVQWAWSRLWFATGRPLPGQNRISTLPGLLVLEADDGRGPALAILAEEATAEAGEGSAEPGARPGGSAPNGAPLHASLRLTRTLTPRRRTVATFFIGAGRERDGAVAAARAMQRAGSDALLRQCRLDLSVSLRAAQDHRWADMLNRNLLFNRFFAVGRAIDDDQLWLLRSRSTRCPEPALFNEREALFWTMPALIASDPGVAREALLRCFDLYSERSGEHLRYLDGAAFDSGFVLEQFLLYAWAVDTYVTATGDVTVLDEPVVQHVLLENDTALYLRLHPEHHLCSSEVLPSGDAADHPYTVMGNALLRTFADALPRLRARPDGSDEPPPRFEGTGGEVAAAIWQHCVVDVDGEQVLASSSDLEGGAAVYDDPAMSLALLPFFGFCGGDDPIWGATMAFLRSGRYPLFVGGVVPGIARRGEQGRVAVAALVADLLGPASAEALDRLLKVRFEGGIAAASCDPATGDAAHPHHAALAGFLAWALIRAAEPAASSRRRPPRR